MSADCKFRGYFTHRIDGTACLADSVVIRRSLFDGITSTGSGGAIGIVGFSLSLSISDTGFCRCACVGSGYGGGVYGGVLESGIARGCFDLCVCENGDNALFIESQKAYPNAIDSSSILRCCDDGSSDGRSALLGNGKLEQSNTNYSHGCVGVENGVIRFSNSNSVISSFNLYTGMLCQKTEVVWESCSSGVELVSNVYARNDGSRDGGFEFYDSVQTTVSLSLFVEENFQTFSLFNKIKVQSSHFCANLFRIPGGGVQTDVSLKALSSPHAFICGKPPSSNFTLRIPHFRMLLISPVLFCHT